MNNEETNRYIHVEIMGKCWHEREVDDKGTGGFKVKLRCVICGDSRYRIYCGGDNPKYTSDESPRRLLNEVVAKMVTGECEVDFLRAEHFISQIADFHTYSPLPVNGDIYSKDAYAMAVATAEQIATACVEAHKLTAKPAA